MRTHEIPLLACSSCRIEAKRALHCSRVLGQYYWQYTRPHQRKLPLGPLPQTASCQAKLPGPDDMLKRVYQYS